MCIEGYSRFGGRHCETAALRNVMAHMQVLDPRTRQPFSEEMLLGLGGGIGVAYWVFEMGHGATFCIGTRHGGKFEFLEKICGRAGLRLDSRETSGALQGEKDLRDILRNGRPAIVRGDMAYLPYLALPSPAHFGGHTFVVYGIDDAAGVARVADRAAAPLTVRLAELAAARGSRHQPFPPHHKLFEVLPHRGPLSAARLRRGVTEAIAENLPGHAPAAHPQFWSCRVAEVGGAGGRHPAAQRLAAQFPARRRALRRPAFHVYFH